MAISEEPQRYSCATQQELEATLLPEQERSQDDERPSAGHGEDAIVVGMVSQVPRWDVVTNGPRQLKYFVQVAKFPSPTRAEQAKEAFQQAANMWNKMDLGISIVEAPDAASAHFDLSYWIPDSPKDRTLAMAFFPNERDQTVWIYQNALQPKNIEILVSVCAHEIGHILGLRHEFAITGDVAKGLKAEKELAVPFGEANYNSVMSYNFPPTIQDTDVRDTQEFYKLHNGELIKGLPVTDYVPVLKKRNLAK